MGDWQIREEEIVRSVIAQISDQRTAAILTGILIELDGEEGLELLSKTRAAISLRMQEMIDAKWLSLTGSDLAPTGGQG